MSAATGGHSPEEPTNFVCVDCGVTVFRFVSFHDNDQDICVQCQWLRDLPEETRGKALQFFKGLNRTASEKEVIE